MSGEFDVCVGVSRRAVNEALASLHRSLGPEAFTETLESDDGKLSYRLCEAPELDFEPVADEGGVLGALGGEESTVCVALRLNQVSLDVETDVYSKTVRIAASARCEISVDEEGTLSFEPSQVSLAWEDRPSILDRVVNSLLLPALLEVVRELVVGVRLPPVRFAGLALGSFVLAVAGDHVLVAANLEEKGRPRLPANMAIPPLGFFLLLSDRFRLVAARALVEGRCKTLEREGRLGLPFTRLRWAAEVCISDVEVSLAGRDSFRVTGLVVGRIELAVRQLFEIGASFNLYPEPQPHARIRLFVEEEAVKVAVHDLDSFRFRVSPTGDFFQRMTAGALEPAANAISRYLTPLLVGYLGELVLPVWEIEDVPIEEREANLVISPRNVRLEPFDDKLCVGADLGVRGEARPMTSQHEASEDRAGAEARNA